MVLTKDKLVSINIDNFIDSKIRSSNMESLLLIVPTNRKLRELKKRIIRNFKNEPITKINIETFTTVSNKINKEYRNFTELSEAASTVLIKETVSELELSYFATYSKGIPFGTLDRIKNVISKYKKHGIAPLTLVNEAEKLTGGEKNKAIDIASIYTLYLQKCKNLSALEIGDVYNTILEISHEEFSQYFFNCFNNVSQILLTGFDEFTALEINLLEMFSKAVDSKLIINLDYFGNNHNIFSHLDESYNKLIERGFTEITDITPLGDNKFRNLTRAYLFKNNLKINKNYQNVLFKIEAKNRVEEIEIIARNIKADLIEGSVKPEKICVSFNLVGKYSSIIRDVFSKYGLPFNLSDRVPLKTSPPVIAAISLLELLENDFYYHDLGRVLTNGFLEFTNVDYNNLLSVANELKITSNQKNWTESINDALTLLHYNNDISEFEKNKLIRKYKKAENDIMIIVELLLPLRKQATCKEFILNFKKLILKLKLPCKVINSSSNKEEEFIKAITVLLQTITEVLLLTNKTNPDQKHHLSYYIEQIKTIATWARFNVKEKSDYGILVTSVNEIRGLTFDHLYIGGMCDGDFPTRYSPEIFFSGSFQKKERMHQTEERYHFYQTLSSWNKKLFISVPQNDNNSELVESTFVKDFEELFEMSSLVTDRSHVYTKEDLLIEFGKNEDNIQLETELESLGYNTANLKAHNEIRDLRNENPFTSNSYNGFLNNSGIEISNFLEKLNDREFSISQLETFAKCPFKYYSERILKLEPLEEPSDEVEPIELGNVLHSILYDFYIKIKNEQIEINKIGTAGFSKLKNILFEIAEKRIRKLNLNSPIVFFEKEKILGIDGKKENSILYKFLTTESEAETNYKPELFEHNFGHFSDEEIESIPELKIGQLKLRGKIDRIDIDQKSNSFNVIDYKLKGKKPSIKDLLEGLALQLPVYLMAGEHIFESQNNIEMFGNKMIIYSLNYKDDKFGPSEIKVAGRKKISDDEQYKMNTDIIENTKIKLLEYHEKISEGSFHISSLDDREEKVCKYCDFKSLCRVKEVFEA